MFSKILDFYKFICILYLDRWLLKTEMGSFIEEYFQVLNMIYLNMYTITFVVFYFYCVLFTKNVHTYHLKTTDLAKYFVVHFK